MTRCDASLTLPDLFACQAKAILTGAVWVVAGLVVCVGGLYAVVAFLDWEARRKR